MSNDLLILPAQDATGLRWANRLADEEPGINVILAEDEAHAVRVLESGVRAAFGTLTPTLLAAAGDLEWLQAPMAAPPAGFYFPALVDSPVVVTNVRGPYTEPVATHAVALLLALARNLPYYFQMQAEKKWAPDKREETVLHLQESTVLIVGLGAVGEYIARLLRPLGCRILATDARREDQPASVDVFGRPADLEDYLGEADAVVLTVPHTPETFQLMNSRTLRLMKPTAMLVNIGRGAVVDVDALAAALHDGVIRAAAIDVVPEEPLPADHPLWSEPRAIITPHVAAVSPNHDDKRFAVVRDNTLRFFAGEPLVNIVDKAAWY